MRTKTPVELLNFIIALSLFFARDKVYNSSGGGINYALAHTSYYNFNDYYGVYIIQIRISNIALFTSCIHVDTQEILGYFGFLWIYGISCIYCQTFLVF